MTCDTRLLDRLRHAAILRARGARTQWLRQRHMAVAQSHADDANRLRGTGGTTGWLSIAAWTDWRPALLRATNDL